MKKIRILALAASSIFVTSPLSAVDFTDIQFWVGSGANQAALVFDWNDGKSAESLVWGYRWDGSASGADMFTAVVNADPRLFAHLGTFNFGSGPEPGVFGIGYDLNANGVFGVASSPPLSFDSGGLAVDSIAVGDGNVDPAGTPTDAGDHWLESWFPAPGFWGYYAKSSTAGAWDFASSGAAGRILSDGIWDGYSFATDFLSATVPSEPIVAPVPEPATWAFLILSGFLLLCARRKLS